MTNRTNIYFDFEFIDDGREIVPLSLGMCTNDGKHLYREYPFDPARANDWVREHVFPQLDKPRIGWEKSSRAVNASIIESWVKDACGDNKPQFWGYFPSYDWVCLCQHYGAMMQMPKGWPFRPGCLMQLADYLGVARDDFPKQVGEHHALNDAKWNRELHGMLCSSSPAKV